MAACLNLGFRCFPLSGLLLCFFFCLLFNFFLSRSMMDVCCLVLREVFNLTELMFGEF